MSELRNREHHVLAFLEEGPAILSDRVLEDVRRDIHRTPQRRRQREMRSGMLRFAPVLGAVLVFIAIVFGLAWAIGQLRPSVGAPVAPATASVPASLSPEPTPSEVPNPCDVGTDFGEVPAGATCWIDPDADEATSLRVLYDIPAEGWSAFIGTFKDVGEGEELQRVNVLMAKITNVTVDACTDQVALNPPVGPSVDDLAAALAALPPFEVASPPSDVTAFGYSGRHLEITVPTDVTWEVIAGTPLFTDCFQGVLRTWISPQLSFAYYGYTAPGDTEEFWILDVEGTRLVIAAQRSANVSAELLAEQQEVLDSIVIEP